GAHTDLEEFEVRSVRTVTVGLRHGRALRAYSDGEPRSLLPVTAAVLPGAARLLADPAAAGPRQTGDRLGTPRQRSPPAGQKRGSCRTPSWGPSPAGTPSRWTISRCTAAAPSRRAARCWWPPPPERARPWSGSSRSTWRWRGGARSST